MTGREPSEYAGKTVTLRADAALLGGQEYRVEDWWTNVFGQSWMVSQSPVAYQYAIRGAGLPLDDEVLYGKVGLFGHLVHISEIEVAS